MQVKTVPTFFYDVYINAITKNGSNAGSCIKCSRILTQ